MIDTSKYVGHAEGDWNWTKLGTLSGILLDKHGKDIVQLMMPYDLYSNPTDATAQLIADAPQILQALINEQAEVKRLRGILGDITAIDEWGGDGKDVGITITYSEFGSFTGWLNKCTEGEGDDE